VLKCQRFIGIKIGGKRITDIKTIEVPRSMEETYVGNETRTVTENFEAFRLKFSEDELYQKAKNIIAARINSN